MKRGLSAEIAQRVSNLADCLVEAVIEVYGRLWPRFAAQLLPCHQFSRVFQQDSQQSKGLLLQPEALAVPRKLAGSKISVEHAKSQTPGPVISLLQGLPRANGRDPPPGASWG